MDDFQSFLESVFFDIRLEDSVDNTRTKYTVPERWQHLIDEMIEDLEQRRYEVQRSAKEGNTLDISWAHLEKPNQDD